MKKLLIILCLLMCGCARTIYINHTKFLPKTIYLNIELSKIYEGWFDSCFTISSNKNFNNIITRYGVTTAFCKTGFYNCDGTKFDPSFYVSSQHDDEKEQKFKCKEIMVSEMNASYKCIEIKGSK